MATELHLASSGGTISVGSASGTNTAGSDIMISAGQGTGSGSGGDIIFQTAPAAATGGSTANTLTTALTIDSSGHVIKPLNTAFKTTQTGALSVADGHTLFSTNTTEVKDLNADLSGATFTAPVDGFYYISASILYQSIGSGDTDTVEDTFVFSNGNEIISRAGKANNALSSGGCMESAKATIAFMDANDTVDIAFGQNGGAQQTDVSTASYFYGYLLG